MRTTLELPDPLFARLKARAADEGVTLKQLPRSYVEQGLGRNTAITNTPLTTGKSRPLIRCYTAGAWLVSIAISNGLQACRGCPCREAIGAAAIEPLRKLSFSGGHPAAGSHRHETPHRRSPAAAIR